MPKVVLIPEDKTKEQMLRCIDSKLAYYGMCKKDLAKAMDVSGKTVTNRYNQPELFTLKELLRICKRLKIEMILTEKGVECR